MHIPFSRILLLAASGLPLVVAGADWPQFRGPGGSGVASVTGVPSEWSASKGILWKSQLPGFGASSPAVLGGKIYVACYSGYGLGGDSPGDPRNLVRHVVCYDVNGGAKIWDTPFPSQGAEQPYGGYQGLHGYASSTPAVDGDSIYAFLGRDGVAALSLSGEKKWQVSVGTKTHDWGSATSPVVFENVVIVNASVESGALVGLDKRTGRELWRAGGINMSWNTPALVAVPGGGSEVVVSSRNELLAFDPATGQKLWSCAGIQDYVCPSVVSHEGVVYAIGGRKGTALAVKAGGRGDVTATHRLWTANKGSNVSSPVYYEGHLYFLHESRGFAYCLNAKTGETVYEQRLEPRPKDRIYASPLVADGKIYVVDRSGGTYVLPAKPEFRILAYNAPLDDSVLNGSPVPAGPGKLLLRSDKFLYCIGS